MGEFGDLLRACRLKVGWTQEHLAERSGVSNHAISMLESGRRRPRLSTVSRLADAMALEPADRNRIVSAVNAQGSAAPAGVGGSPSRPAELQADLHDFTGRSAVTEQLAALLQDHCAGPVPPVVLTAISGAGGVGKTTLAVHVAHQVIHSFPDGQLQVDLQGAEAEPTAPHDVLARFLRALGVAPEQIPADADERAARYRTLLADRRVLVFLDNVRDAAQIRPLLPGAGRTRVLITSRSTLPGLDGAARLTLDRLTAEEASALLRRIIGDAAVDAEPGAAAEALDACAGLPLAIRLAGSRLVARPDWSVRDLAGLLADETRRLNELRVEDRAVRATFAVSYRNLPPAQARAFRLLGSSPGPTTSLEAAAALLGMSAAEASGLLGDLAATSLIELTGTGRFRQHDLIRVYAAECAAEEPPGERDAATDRLLTWLLYSSEAASRRLYPGRRHLDLPDAEPGCHPKEFADQDEALTWSASEGDCLVAAVTAAAQTGRHRIAWQLANTMWELFDLRPEQPGRVRTYEAAVASAQKLDDLEAESWALNALGAAYLEAPRLADAEDCLLRSLEIRGRLGDVRGQASCMGNLGHLRTEAGRAAEALPLLERTAEIYHDLGAVHSEGSARLNLGEAEKQLGRLDAALGHYRHALRLFRDAGSEHRAIGRTLSNIADTLLLLDRTHEAAELATEACTINNRVGNRVDEAVALEVLGHFHAADGDDAMARQQWAQAHVIFRELSHPRAATLGETLRAHAPEL
ncbi:helix-turn-helix domain-containing protein [Streptacidiphilus fuscans]|uniref:Tetratricopeptide repeat protein n=1 Tax=Streptacidiphilus fuscans TaxID=2789292 RepID=A0A931FDT9_9ACTN|nr:helix-turn-helix domain-containing protein [Streptacidiphilus fuscans]MBF9069918.1 tetratricopeptide repeat protein [Streptacidiphilus fuscans]